MPTYEYLCRDCGEHFDLRRPMSEASAAANCPQGHADTVKLLSTVALAGRGAARVSGRGETPVGATPAGGGGCCGGGCGCGG